MKKTGILIVLAAFAASTQAAVILWEDTAPVGGNMSLTATTETAVTGSDTGHGDIGLFDAAEGAQYRNYNITGQDWSAYAGQEWTLSVDIYITSDQLADPNIADDSIYYSIGGVSAGWTTVGTLTADAWNTYTKSGTFTTDANALTNTSALFLNNDKNTDGALGANYYVDNFKLEVVPEPGTLGLIAVFGGGVLFIRRRFMM
ncbi:PEP-CTERM sorting domain-containing protein [Verrucomicrobia bacterium S94]|nr:PEP-CTERM sorting domain-containing protein [Verrucomicrobia bacterium S94]